MDGERKSCPERALWAFDLMALAVVALAVFALARGGGEMATTAPLNRSWGDLALGIAAPGFMIATMWFGRRRGSGEDEYVKRMISFATATGIFLTLCIWVGWDILAQSWVLGPTGGQIVGILLVSTALAYGWARLRGA